MRVGLNVYLVSQNWDANLSTFYWELTFVNASGNPTWIADPVLTWQANVGGAVHSGNWSIPYADRGKNKVLANGYFDRAHDSNGFLAGFPNSGYIGGNAHSNIGSGWTPDVYVDAPRHARAPGPPGTPYLYSLFDPASARVILPPSSDDGGATIDMYLVRLSKNANPETAPYVDLGLSPSQLFGDFTNLDPGTRYYMNGYAHNARGWTRQSGSPGYFDTQAGVFVSDGASWVPSGPRVSDGAAWATNPPKYNDGDSWEDPID